MEKMTDTRTTGKKRYTVVGFWVDGQGPLVRCVKANDANDAITRVNHQQSLRIEAGGGKYRYVLDNLAICAVFAGWHECQ